MRLYINLLYLKKEPTENAIHFPYTFEIGAEILDYVSKIEEIKSKNAYKLRVD